MPLVELNGIRINYEEHGSPGGEAILLTHAFAATLQMWNPQFEALRDYRVIGWDMRGHGGTDSPPEQDAYTEKLTVEDMAVGFIRFENGAVVTLESSFMANIKEEFFRTELFGTKSGAIVKVGNDDPIEIYTEQNKQLFDLKPKNIPDVDSMYVAEIQAFVRAIANGTDSPVPGENGLTLNAIFDALYKSTETGKEEAVDVGL